MRPKSAKLLWDICDVARFLIADASGVSLPEYEEDRRLRHAVERSFEIIGEAARRLESDDPETAARLTALRQVIGLRNRIAHGYDDIDNARVLAIIKTQLPQLLLEAEALLPSLDLQPGSSS